MTTFLVFPSPENIQMQHLWMDCYKFQSFSVFHLMFTIKMEGGVLWLCQKFIIFIMNFIIEDIIWSKNLITYAYCVAYKVSAIFIKWFGCYNILLFHFSFVGVYRTNTTLLVHTCTDCHYNERAECSILSEYHYDLMCNTHQKCIILAGGGASRPLLLVMDQAPLNYNVDI